MDPAVHDYPTAGPIPPNEVVGVVFDPSGTRMYFGLQRTMSAGFPAGVVYEVSGPFRKPSIAMVPATRLTVQKRIRIPKYLRRGLPLRLELGQRAGVAATLRISSRGSGGRRRASRRGRRALRSPEAREGRAHSHHEERIREAYGSAAQGHVGQSAQALTM